MISFHQLPVRSPNGLLIGIARNPKYIVRISISDEAFEQEGASRFRSVRFSCVRSGKRKVGGVGFLSWQRGGLPAIGFAQAELGFAFARAKKEPRDRYKKACDSDLGPYEKIAFGQGHDYFE